MNLRRSLLALVATAFLFTPLAATAGDKVRVTVHVIHASKTPGKVDDRVKNLVKEMENFGFKSFTVHRVQELKLKLNKPGEVELPDDRKLVVTALSRDAAGKLKIQVTIEKVVDTTYTISDGASILFGGPRHDDGTMVLAITQSSD